MPSIEDVAHIALKRFGRYSRLGERPSKKKMMRFCGDFEKTVPFGTEKSGFGERGRFSRWSVLDQGLDRLGAPA